MTGLPRRRLMLRALAGFAGTGLLPLAAGQARAVPSDPGAGPKVTPDPIKAKIQKSGVAVELADFTTPARSASKRPYALFNYLYHAKDGSGRVYVADARGKLWQIDGKKKTTKLFLDLAKLRGNSFLVAGQMGLRSFAFHPDYARKGQPGYRRLYTAHTETPASRSASVKLFEAGFPVLFHDVVTEWQADSSGGKVLTSSRRELFRIPQYKKDHNTDQLVFDPHAKPGEAAYGKMFVGVGDGGNVPEHPDLYDQAQDGLQPLGKIYRVDPLKQKDGRAYGVPADNPFVGDASYLPEIWALGLRHPQNLSFDQGGAGTFLIADIGQAQIEEVNLGIKGANYGWPLREGPFVTDRMNEAELFALPGDDAKNGFTYPVAMYDHDEGLAITGGFVYRGKAVPALLGHYLFGDIVNGRVFHVPVADLVLGRQAVVKELTLLKKGKAVTLSQLAGASSKRADLRFGQDEGGEVYVMTKQDGKIRKLAAA